MIKAATEVVSDVKTDGVSQQPHIDVDSSVSVFMTCTVMVSIRLSTGLLLSESLANSPTAIHVVYVQRLCTRSSSTKGKQVPSSNPMSDPEENDAHKGDSVMEDPAAWSVPLIVSGYCNHK